MIVSKQNSRFPLTSLNFTSAYNMDGMHYSISTDKVVECLPGVVWLPIMHFPRQVPQVLFKIFQVHGP